MKLLRIFLFLMLPALSWAQSVVITGKITSVDTKEPIAGASVFLSNSSSGTSTTKDGSFILNGLKEGQYTLVVSSVGYEDHVQVVNVNNAAMTLNVQLNTKVNQLNEVTISVMSKADKREALQQFTRDFIGTDDNAQDCDIINPDVIHFTFHQNKTVLTAYTDQFLIVENNSLGYRIKFLLKNFKSEILTGIVAYSGNQFFEEMKGSKSDKKDWHQKRDEAYYGSAMHFYRSLYKDSLDDAGYRVYDFSRNDNIFRPSDEEIAAHMANAKNLAKDSLLFWTKASQSSRYANQKFHGRLNVKDILRPVGDDGLKELTFPNHLYVVYTKKWEANYYREIYRSPGDLNYQTTIVTLINDNHSIVIDKNGTVVGKSPAYEGSWSQARLSVLLPVDYTPYSTQQQVLESKTLKRD